jgi:hypothetical protein
MYQFNHFISHIIDMFSQHLADMALMQLYFILKNAEYNDHNIAIVQLRDNTLSSSHLSAESNVHQRLENQHTVVAANNVTMLQRNNINIHQ